MYVYQYMSVYMFACECVCVCVCVCVLPLCMEYQCHLSVTMCLYFYPAKRGRLVSLMHSNNKTAKHTDKNYGQQWMPSLVC